MVKIDQSDLMYDIVDESFGPFDFLPERYVKNYRNLMFILMNKSAMDRKTGRLKYRSLKDMLQRNFNITQIYFVSDLLCCLSSHSIFKFLMNQK
jgi:hypothetical protein